MLASASLAPTAASGLAFGLADQNAAAFGEQRVAALGLREARLIVPWDVMATDPGPVATWLEAVRHAGLRPQVGFGARRGDACPGTPCSTPTPRAYGEAVADFVAAFPEVRRYTTWNEANHATQPTARRPELVAEYYRRLRAVCPTCAVVGADVLDDDARSVRRWLTRFRVRAPRARLWGLHDYGDATYGRTSGLRTVLRTVPGHVWINETGGIVRIRDAAGHPTFMATEREAAQAVRRAVRVARSSRRVTAAYIYQWQAHVGDRFDAGLVRPDGASRPSLAALASAMRARRTTIAHQAR
jgi:hypothetical protein